MEGVIGCNWSIFITVFGDACYQAMIYIRTVRLTLADI